MAVPSDLVGVDCGWRRHYWKTQPFSRRVVCRRNAACHCLPLSIADDPSIKMKNTLITTWTQIHIILWAQVWCALRLGAHFDNNEKFKLLYTMIMMCERWERASATEVHAFSHVAETVPEAESAGGDETVGFLIREIIYVEIVATRRERGGGWRGNVLAHHGGEMILKWRWGKRARPLNSLSWRTKS